MTDDGWDGRVGLEAWGFPVLAAVGCFVIAVAVVVFVHWMGWE